MNTFVVLSMFLSLPAAAADPAVSHRGATGSYQEIGSPAPAAGSGSQSGAVTEPWPFTAMISAGAGWGLPFNGFYDEMQGRISYHGEARIAVSATHYLGLIYRNQQLLRGEVMVQDPYTGQYVPADAALDLRQFLFMFGKLSNPVPGGTTRTYVEFGAGLGNHVATASHGGRSGSDTLRRFLLAMQVGVLFDIGSGGLGGDVGISLISKIFSPEQGEDIGFVAGAHAGLTWSFGKN